MITFFFCICNFEINSSEKATITGNIQEEKILWSLERKLTWEDFKGKNTGDFGTRKAATTAQILTVHSYYDESGVPVFEIGCFFYPYRSWSIISDEFALQHEQLHFDIGELYARKIRKKFDSLYQVKERDTEIYRVIFHNLDNECRKRNDVYDSEVYRIEENGEVIFNHDKQQEWIQNITSEIHQLKAYAYPN